MSSIRAGDDCLQELRWLTALGMPISVRIV